MRVRGAGDPGCDASDAPAGSAGRWRRLYLLRHGEVAYVGPDGRPADSWQVSLTAYGKVQAAGLAAALSGCGVELLVTSAVPRANETAAILAVGTGLVPVVDEGWNELRPGDLAALPPARLRAVIVDAYRDAAEPGASFFGGEGFGDSLAGLAMRSTACWLRRTGAPRLWSRMIRCCASSSRAASASAWRACVSLSRSPAACIRPGRAVGSSQAAAAMACSGLFQFQGRS